MAHIKNLFETYDDALAAAGDGYDNDDLARVVALKTQVVARDLERITLNPDPTAVINAAVCAAIAQRSGEICRVVDLGGASGYHYLCAKSFLDGHPHFWTVVETPAMVRAAEPLFGSSTLRFVSEFEEAFAGEIDVLVFSGTLQCMPQPEDALRRVATAKPRRIVLARFPAYEGPRVVGLQQSQLSHNGPGPMPDGIADRTVLYPVTFVPMSDVLSRLEGYRVAQRYDSPSGTYEIDRQRVAGTTLLLERE